MNELLPIMLMLLLGKKDGNTLDALAPIIKMLGADEKMLEGLKGITGGGLSVEKLLPLMMSVMNGSRASGKPSESNLEQNKNGGKESPSAPNYLNPITDIADERINYALAHYFANS